MTTSNENPKAELMQKLTEAMAAGNTKDAAELSDELSKLMKAEIESARLGRADKVKKAIMKAIKPLVDAKELDEDDGIWFSWDFGDKEPQVKLNYTITKVKTNAGGAGKVYDVKTEDLLKSHGHLKFDDKMTCREAHDKFEGDGNKRYLVRVKLLELAGYKK